MGLYFKGKVKENGMMAVWELTESESELEKVVPCAESMVGKAKSRRRKKELLVVQILITEIFGSDVSLDHHPTGEPFLKNRSDYITISHSHRFVVLLTHPFLRVGVDIECMDRNFSAVEHKALSLSEISFLKSGERLRQLAILWSAKEALYKFLSIKKIDFAKQIEVESFNLQDYGVLTAQFIDNNQKSSTHLMEYKIFDNHILVYIFAE